MSAPVVSPPPVTAGPKINAAVAASAMVTLAIAAVMVALRIYTRSKISRTLGVEDWLLVAALVFSLGHSIGSIVESSFGLGNHIWVLSPEDFVNLTKASLAITVCYQLSFALTKVSILFLYLRILMYRFSRHITYALLATVVMYNIFGFIAEMTTCVPLEKLWDQSMEGTCHPESFLSAIVGMHIATDFLIFFLPLPIFFRVTMPIRMKITLLVLFGLGFFTCLVAILRVVWLKQLYHSQDPTWDFISIAHWSLVEVNIAIVCACLMTMKPLIANFFPDFLQPNRAYQQYNDVGDHPRTIGVTSFRPGAPSKPTNAYLADQSIDQSSTPGSDHYIRMEDLKGRDEDTSGLGRLEEAYKTNGKH